MVGDRDQAQAQGQRLADDQRRDHLHLGTGRKNGVKVEVGQYGRTRTLDLRTGRRGKWRRPSWPRVRPGRHVAYTLIPISQSRPATSNVVIEVVRMGRCSSCALASAS